MKHGHRRAYMRALSVCCGRRVCVGVDGEDLARSGLESVLALHSHGDLRSEPIHGAKYVKEKMRFETN